MKIALYGMPSAGKSTLMSKITGAKVLNGSQELRRISGGEFSELSEEEKCQARIYYTEYVNSLEDELIVSDGHYSFMENVVFTEADGELYDTFIYLYCAPEVLKERYTTSEKNAKFSGESIEDISQWQDFEIRSLREECHKRNKDFYLISDNGTSNCMFYDFLDIVKKGFSTYKMAYEIAQKIMMSHQDEETIYIVDGDKTIIVEDSYRFCCNGKTEVFDGDFYTGYQSFLFERELQTATIDVNKITDIQINKDVYDKVGICDYVILSSGIESLWSMIAKEKNLKHVYASTYICADTKYYVVKILQKRGYKVETFGDSKIDLYMLRKADKGTLYIGKRMSRSLKNENLSGLKLIYDHSLVVLMDEEPDIMDDIAICKSNSGINGSKLAAAHMRLGEKLGKRIAEIFPEKNTAILTLERGGRFFGDGIYMGFDGDFYAVNPRKEVISAIDAERVIIVDSVINTGKSIVNVISQLKGNNPDVEIVIAANVIQNEAIDLFSEYLVFTTRISKNSFVGKNQAKQTGKAGPDTADRLFNLIKKRY